MFQSESILCSWLNVNDFLARSRREIWGLSDCNWTRTHKHLVHKRSPNYVSIRLWTKWFVVRVQLQSLKHYLFLFVTFLGELFFSSSMIVSFFYVCLVHFVQYLFVLISDIVACIKQNDFSHFMKNFSGKGFLLCDVWFRGLFYLIGCINCNKF